MGEGEHTIIGKLPRERLNQIASRKLSSLAIPVRLGADRETLEGELAFSGRVVHPATGQAVPRARFSVAGHDRLRFPDPPLAALGSVEFYDAERGAAVEERIAQALRARWAGVQQVAARMRALKLEASVDPERLAARAVVKTTTHAFELLGGPEGVRVARVAPVGGKPFEVAPNFPGIRLEDFPSAVDLEVHLVHAVPAMSLAQPTAPTPAPRPAGLQEAPPPRNAVTVRALESAFGGDCTFAPTAGVEVVREFESGGTHYRFVATREAGTTFRARLIGPGGDVWSDRFDLAAFPGTRAVVAAALGLAPSPTPPPVGSAAALAAAAGVPQHLAPRPGEVWVMSVVVEASDGDEVRYVGTDIDGRPYGAARVLKQAEFDAVFSRERGGFRLLVTIDQVQGDAVVYRQLDAQRQPVGSPRLLSTAVLVANFVPEAAAF